ncbi:MAG TPA: glycosyltransferase family 39 protein [Candidatus Binatia bacterium]|nr:glycosyltransferase family 39 protein [Candidatus Binatia bacterium]
MRALALALSLGALLAVHLTRPGFLDDEGRNAEVAREMLVLGDWLTPHLDFTLYLNKPPLPFWLAAIAFRAGLTDERARVVSLLAAVVTLVATAALGRRLYDEPTGLLGAALLASSVGFALEARTLRADIWLVASVTVAFLAWTAAEEADGWRRGAWLVALYTALGVGGLAKGLVCVVLAGVPIAALAMVRHGLRACARLHPELGLLVFAVIPLPWHAAVALRHPGFAWDYVVNQHLLFFFDRKLPRDSEGDPLLLFWASFVGRHFPWILLVPLAAGELGSRRRGDTAARGTAVLATWAGSVLAFFSASPARLEHYLAPAAPPMALLAARGLALHARGEAGAAAWRRLAGAGVVLAAIGVAGAFRGPPTLAGVPWLAGAPGLPDLAKPAGEALALSGLLVASAAGARRPRALAAAFGATAALTVGFTLVALARAEPLVSWAPLARAVARAVPPGVPIAFDASDEYQVVGGLAFYTQRQILLLEPPHFVPPTYLAGQSEAAFVSRARFAAAWRAGTPLALVSDPKRPSRTPAHLAPGSFLVVAAAGGRWAVADVPFAAESRAAAAVVTRGQPRRREP